MKRILIALLVVFLLIGLGAYYYLQEKGPPKAPTLVKITNVKLSDVKLPPEMSVNFNANAILNNPNDFGVNISGMDFDVYVNGKKTTRINREVDSKMPANSDFTLPIRFEIPLKDEAGLKGLGGLLQNALKNKAMDIRSEGTISVKVLSYDFEIPFEYEDNYRLKDYLNINGG